MENFTFIRKFIAALVACVLLAMAPGLPCYQAAAAQAQARGIRVMDAPVAALAGVDVLAAYRLAPALGAFNAAQALTPAPMLEAGQVQAPSAAPIQDAMAPAAASSDVPARVEGSTSKHPLTQDARASVGTLAPVAANIAQQARTGDASAADRFYDLAHRGAEDSQEVTGAPASRGLSRSELRPGYQAVAGVSAGVPNVRLNRDPNFLIFSVFVVVMLIVDILMIRRQRKQTDEYKYQLLLKETEKALRKEIQSSHGQAEHPFLQYVIELQKNKKYRERRSALSRLQHPSIASISFVPSILLATAYHHKSSLARREAIEAMGEIALRDLPNSDEVVVRLAQVLEKKNSTRDNLYVDLSRVLRRVAENTAVPLPRRLSALAAFNRVMHAHPSADVRNHARVWLSHLLAQTSTPGDIVPGLKESIRSLVTLDPDVHVRAGAAHYSGLDDWGPIVDDLIQDMLHNPDPKSRVHSANMLGGIGQKLPESDFIARRIVSRLVYKVQVDRRAEVRGEAAKALWIMGSSAHGALAGLQAALITGWEKDENVRHQISETIRHIERETKPAAPKK